VSINRGIQRAIEDGRRNADGFTLVKNWCAHVRIERFGGVGMVEAATGLPIGLHGLACDHAPAGGLMSPDIRDAALYFHDRNCHRCTLREVVALPNLGSWLVARDEEVAKRELEEAANAGRIAAKLAERQAARAELRVHLQPAAADVIDQIEELDLKRTPEFAARLVETARLAPEAFPPALVEMAFGLIEGHEQWFDEAGLRALAAVSADPARLTKCVMLCLQRHSATRSAVSILLTRLPLVDAALIPAILPTVIRMAAPARISFETEQPPKIAALVRLNVAFPRQVAATLDALLEGEPQNVSLAARAVRVLARRDPTLAIRCARALISKLVRAKWLPDPHDHGHDDNERVARELTDAIVEAFICDPSEIDDLLQAFGEGASEAGMVRIFSVYGRVLHYGRFRAKQAVRPADRVAFRRLLWEAPKTKNDKVLHEIQRVINRSPGELADLARDEIDALLGAAILMDARIVALDAEPRPKNAMMLHEIGLRNQRQTLADLRSSFVSWAAAGASAGGRPQSYLEVLRGLPEDRDELAACMLRGSVGMMHTAAGLNAVLPSLYSALVGTSVLGRGSAATVVGKLPWRQRENVPDLLLEALITTLTDSYVYVHSAAVTAISRFRLPAQFDARVRNGLFAVLLAHEKNPDQQDIVLECINLLVARYLTTDELAGHVGAFLVGLLARMPTWRTSKDVRFLARQLAYTDGFVELLVNMLDPDADEYEPQNALDALAELPEDVIHSHRGKLAEIPIGTNWVSRQRVLILIELLTRSKCWAEAEELAAAAVEAIPNNIREAATCLIFELAHAATSFEHALARSDHDRVPALAKRWHEVRLALEANDNERARRPDPFQDLRGPHRGG
jgi:hypothetical protein